MKKLLFVLFAVVLAGTAFAQRVFDPMDNAVGTNWPDPAVRDVNFYTNGTESYMNLYNETTDFKEGTGSMKIDYRVDAQDGWGGYTVRVTGTTPFSPTMDASAGTEIKFWYKVVNPLVKTSGDGNFVMEFKIGEFDDEGNRDLWLTNTPIDFSDASGEWIQATIPIAVTGDRTTGFELQFGDGDGELQVHKIGSYELAMVHAGSITGSGTAPYPYAAGTVLVDGFSVWGNAHPPIFSFDNSAASWNLDWMDWAGADKGAIAVSDEAADKVEGDGSLKIDYTLSAPYGWGGFLSIDADVTRPAKFEERTALVLFVKNLVPCTADANRAFMRVFVMENSNGENEEWITDIGIDLSVASDWKGYYLPFVEKPMGVNDRFPPKDGFALKNNAGNKTFNPASITKIRIELFGRGTEDGFAQPLKTTGTLLLDVIQQSGFQFADDVPPAAVSSLLVVSETYSNLVTWQDLQGEEGEKYNVYYSKNPITDINAEGVFPLKTGISGGVQAASHLIRAPKTDAQQTWYYAINCMDKAENVGEIFTSGAITNTAQGIPTVRLTTPNFAADGSLAEWVAAGVTPFKVRFADGSAFIAQNDHIGGPGLTEDDDASGDCYVALDNNYLYVAYNMNDEVVFDDNSYYPGNTWELDATELFMSFYDIDKTPLTKAYKGGTTPDYHLRFNKQKAREDHWLKETDELLLPGENYYWAEKFPAGYIIEARISLADLATKRDNPTDASTLIDTIYATRGMKIGFDWGVFDNDGDVSVRREARIFWSPFNQDQGYQDARLWMYTWLEDDQVVTDVPTETLPLSYSLSQNYPNPFNPSTQLTYSLQKAGMVSLKIYDILGRVVANLVNENKEAGSYTVNFNASQLSSGVYFYKLESGSFTSVKKMMLVK